MPHPVGIEPGLDGFEQFFAYNRFVHAGVDLVAMDDHPEIGAIAQEIKQGAATERIAAAYSAFVCRPFF